MLRIDIESSSDQHFATGEQGCCSIFAGNLHASCARPFAALRVVQLGCIARFTVSTGNEDFPIGKQGSGVAETPIMCAAG